MDLWVHMDWCRGESTISDGAWGTIEQRETSGVLKSKMLVSAEWSVRIGRVTWEWGFEVLWTGDDKLSKFSEKRFIQIRSDLVKLWVVDGIEKKGACLRNTTWQDT